MYILDALKNTAKNNPVLFTTPGHSYGNQVEDAFIKTVGNLPFEFDFSEIEGLDNLQNPEGVIKKSLEWASDIYNSKASFYLINGSSSGIIALMMSIATSNDKVLIARNAHKSVINALIVSGAIPIWFDPTWLSEWNISGVPDSNQIKEYLSKNKDIKAVFITSPTYEGVVADIKAISEVCKFYQVPLIVDEAHAALWNFSDKMPVPAIKLGADASVQSLHKTASCLTQGAILHIADGSVISKEKMQRCLNIINTTSPSYLLLASIEASIEYLNSSNGKKVLDNLIQNVQNFRNSLKKYTEINFLECSKDFSVDQTKICFSIKDISGMDLADYCEENFNLEVELCNNKSIMALTGIGTNAENLNILYKAVVAAQKILDKKNIKKYDYPYISPIVKLSPQQVMQCNTKKISLNKAIGCISAETIVPYPPGIPVLIAGEIIQSEHLKFIEKSEILIIENLILF